jgi:hypothetical protein
MIDRSYDFSISRQAQVLNHQPGQWARLGICVLSLSKGSAARGR